MPRPQNSPRGLFAKQRMSVPVGKGFMFEDYSTTVDLLTADASGLKVVGSLAVVGQAVFGKLDANSTAMILPNSVRVGAKTTYLSSDSTGIKIGSRYISSNTTGNTTT